MMVPPISHHCASHAKAVLANVLWGLVPAYYFLVGNIGPDRMTAYRFVFTFLLLFVAGIVTGRTLNVSDLRRSVIPGILLTINAYVYLLAVMRGFVLEAAYGYLLTPILTVICARLLLGVRFSAIQWSGVLVCGVAITCYAVVLQTLPWFGLGIALPFSLYVTWHKHYNTISSINALRHESTLMLIVPVLYFMLTWSDIAEIVVSELSSWHTLVIAASGLMTVAPLALYISAGPGLSPLLSGLYQFISPIISAIVAVMVFGELLTPIKLLVGIGLLAGMALASLPVDKRRDHLGP